MGRALLVLETDQDRQKAVHWIGKAPVGTRVEFKASKRSLPQNDLMWALLTEVSQQLKPGGTTYDPTQWKAIFLRGFGKEIDFLPTLDGSTFFPIGLSSSDLSKDEMTGFIEFIIKEASDRGVVLKDHRQTEQSNSDEPPHSSEDAGEPARSPAVAGEDTDASSPASSPAASLTEADLGWLKTVTTMLWAATHPGKHNLSILENQKMCVPNGKAFSPAAREKAHRIYEQLEKVPMLGHSKESKRGIIANIAGINPKELPDG